MAGLDAHATLRLTERSGAAVNSFVRNMRRAAAEVTHSGNIADRHTNRLHNSMSRFMRFLGQQLSGTVRSFFYGLRMGVVGAGVAVAAFAASSLKSFRDFDKKLRETTSLIAGSGAGGLKNSFKEAQKAYKDFYTFLLRTAPQMRRTPQDLAGGLYELVQAGLRPAAAKQLLRPAAMGATAGGSDVAPSARVLVQIMNALKMGTTKPGAGRQGQKVMDQIFQAINLGVGVDFPTLSTGIGKFIGSAGVAFKGGRGKGGDNTLRQLMATYIFATQQGARTQDVGVGIQDVIKTIANPSNKGKDFARSIGLGGLGSQFLQTHGFVGSLTTIIQKMKDAGYVGARLNDAIGKLFGDVRGRRIVSYATNINMVNAALKAMGDSTGATQRAFDEQAKSLDASIQTFRSYWETMKIAVGGSIAPYVRRGMQDITGVLQGTGVVGRGQNLLDQQNAAGPGGRRAFQDNLSVADRRAVNQAEKFNRAAIGGKIKMILGEADRQIMGWYRSPITQARFASAIQTIIHKAFDMAGRAIRTIPSIYQFGKTVAAQIIKGVIDGFKEMISGGGGGGGLGMFGSLLSGGPLGGGSGTEKIAGLLMGYGVARSGARKSPLSAGLRAGAGSMMAGFSPMLSGLVGLLSAGNSLRTRVARQGGIRNAVLGTGEGAGGVLNTMNVQASVVYVNGAVAGGAGGKAAGALGLAAAGGIAGPAPKGGYGPVQGPAALNPGYSAVHEYRRNGRIISPSQAFMLPPADVLAGKAMGPGWSLDARGQWRQNGFKRNPSQAVAGAYGSYGTLLPGVTTHFGGFQGPGGGRAPASAALRGPGLLEGPLTEAAYRAQNNRWKNLRLSAQQYQAQLLKPLQGPTAQRIKGIAGNRYAQGAGAGLSTATLMAAGSDDPARTMMVALAGGLVGFGLGGPGGAATGAMVAPALYSMFAGTPKDPGKEAQSRAKTFFSGSGGSFLGPNGAYGASIGQKGGFKNPRFTASNNPLKVTGADASVLFYQEANAAMRTPWNKPGEFEAHLTAASGWMGSSPDAAAFLDELYTRWQDIGKNKAAALIRGGWKADPGGGPPTPPPVPKYKPNAIGQQFIRAVDAPLGHKATQVFDGGFGSGTYDPMGGIGRPAVPGAAAKRKNYNLDFGPGSVASTNVDLWTSMQKVIAPVADKAGTRGPIRFAEAFNKAAKEAPKTMAPAVDMLIKDMTGVVMGRISGGGVTSGPSTAPPPSNNATGNAPTDAGTQIPATGPRAPRGDRIISANGIYGAGEAIGNVMDSAGSKMATQAAMQAAKAITKKQLAGPMGRAYKGLRWLYQQVGKPYIWGGGHPPGPNLKGYDCSGLASSALQVMGSNLAGTTFDMIKQTGPASGLVQLGFNPAKNPHHMGIKVLGKWFEAAHTGAPIRGPSDARSSWPYIGSPKFHKGGVYRSNMAQGDEGPAILRDGELVIRPSTDGGLHAVPVSGGHTFNGPLIGVAHVRHESDVHRIAQELVDLLDKKKQNSGNTR